MQAPHPSPTVTRPRRELILVAVLVAAVEQIGRPMPALWPERQLDVSWMVGLQLARDNGIQYGDDHVFPYGPWGFLSAPSGIDLGDLVLAGIFRGLSVALLFLALHASVRPERRRLAVAVGSTLLIANCSQSGWVLMLGLAAMTLAHLVPSRTPPVGLVVAASALSALSLQIKLSEGVLSIAVVALLLVVSRAWRLWLYAAASFVASFLVLWLAAHQSVTHVWSWLVLSWELVGGYGDAMSYMVNGAILWVMWAGVAAGILAVASARALPTAAKVACFAILLFVSKAGLSRADAAHLLPAYAGVLLVLVVALAASVPRAARVVAIPVTVVLALLLTVNLPTLPPRRVSLDAWPLDASPAGHRARLTEAKEGLVRDLDIESEVLDAVRGHPVSIDPWEISAAWAHDLDWSPLPVFQRYSAYTPTLDEANARALLADPDLRVLREPGVVDEDGRALWEAPRYTMALLCNFEVIAAGAEWSALARVAPRCGAERSLSRVRVGADEVAALPDPAGSVIAVRFAPDPRSPADRVMGILGVQRHLLHARIDGSDSYHVPEAQAGGPLIVGAPAGEPVLFDMPSARTISFDRAGVLEILEISLADTP